MLSEMPANSSVKNSHQPVLLTEVLDALDIKPNGYYVDATFGRGGHSQAIRAKLGATGHLLVLDKDPEAIEAAQNLFGADPQVSIYQASFEKLPEVIEELSFPLLDGILLDLGVSSPQLDDASRGFSFQQDGPLDMRMDPTSGISASAWLARASETEIAWVLKTYGEEKAAKRLARVIVAERAINPLTRTSELANLVARNLKREKHKHPATRTFQAVRIHVNQELQSLEKILASSLDLLKPTGRLAIISFHSLEDRIVKQFFKKSESVLLPRHLPIEAKNLPKGLVKLFKKRTASEAELSQNPRARSAVLRVVEKLL
jgi:16S rRNA (cytosine1402-N4)-methyltransferase